MWRSAERRYGVHGKGEKFLTGSEKMGKGKKIVKKKKSKRGSWRVICIAHICRSRTGCTAQQGHDVNLVNLAMLIWCAENIKPFFFVFFAIVRRDEGWCMIFVHNLVCELCICRSFF